MIENLVAIMILATSIVVLLQLFSGGLRSGRTSSRYSLAVAYAKEKMEELLIPNELPEGEVSGELDNGYSWRAEILFVPPEDEADRNSQDLFRITVQVVWAEGEHEKQVRISTLKLARRMVENAQKR